MKNKKWLKALAALAVGTVMVGTIGFAACTPDEGDNGGPSGGGGHTHSWSAWTKDDDTTHSRTCSGSGTCDATASEKKENHTNGTSGACSKCDYDPNAGADNLIQDPVSITFGDLTEGNITTETALSDYNNVYTYLSDAKLIATDNVSNEKLNQHLSVQEVTDVDGYTKSLVTNGKTDKTTFRTISFVIKGDGNFKIEVVARSCGTGDSNDSTPNRHVKYWKGSVLTTLDDEVLPVKTAQPATVVLSNALTAGTYYISGDANIEIFEVKVTPTEIITVEKTKAEYDLALNENSVNVDDVAVTLVPKFAATGAAITGDWAVSYSLKKDGAAEALTGDAPWTVSETGSYTLTVSAVKDGTTLTATKKITVKNSATAPAEKNWSITPGSSAAEVSGDNASDVTVTLSGTTVDDSTDFKFGGSDNTLTITISGLKAGQTITLNIEAFSGSTEKEGTTTVAIKDVDLQLKSKTNATLTSASDTLNFPGIPKGEYSETNKTAPKTTRTLTLTVDAEGDVVLTFGRKTGNTTKVTKIDIKAE